MNKSILEGHLVEIDLNKVEYELGMSYKEALGMAIRTNNELHDIVMDLQNRILKLEMKLNEGSEK